MRWYLTTSLVVFRHRQTDTSSFGARDYRQVPGFHILEQLLIICEVVRTCALTIGLFALDDVPRFHQLRDDVLYGTLIDTQPFCQMLVVSIETAPGSFGERSNQGVDRQGISPQSQYRNHLPVDPIEFTFCAGHSRESYWVSRCSLCAFW